MAISELREQRALARHPRELRAFEPFQFQASGSQQGPRTGKGVGVSGADRLHITGPEGLEKGNIWLSLQNKGTGC